MAVYIKSALWLVGCGGLGYVLLLATTGSSSSNEELMKKYKIENNTDNKKTVMSVLEKAANTKKPLYSMTKEEIDKEMNKK